MSGRRDRWTLHIEDDKILANVVFLILLGPRKVLCLVGEILKDNADISKTVVYHSFQEQSKKEQKYPITLLDLKHGGMDSDPNIGTVREQINTFAGDINNIPYPIFVEITVESFTMQTHTLTFFFVYLCLITKVAHVCRIKIQEHN